MAVKLSEYQLKAILNLKNGSVLCGGVGSGKSRTAIGYYLFRVCNGSLNIDDGTDLPFKLYDKLEPMKHPRDLYIITTAKKRDSKEWENECFQFFLGMDDSPFPVKVTIDSWNNIKKYRKIAGAFFVFDEQRVVGSGVWVKSFLDIARKNQWILLSATPGDVWTDYIPVFVANGFYRNKTDFTHQHCVYSRYAKYPKIERYVNEEKLIRCRDSILVPMKDGRETIRHIKNIFVDYDRELYRKVMKDRWDPYENEPIQESGKFVHLLRQVVNSDKSRIEKLDEILKDRKYLIVFYNFNYELDLLREYLDSISYTYSEWNGWKHEPLPNESEGWVYLVQYSAGSEGWNCIKTDTIVFFSQNYSYRVFEQACGRIDRINTPFQDLYYFVFRSAAPIDLAIHRALSQKKKFNEQTFVRKMGGFER